MGGSRPDVSDILRDGEPGRAELVRSHRSGLRSPDGSDLYTLVLNVRAPGSPARQVNVGAAVPAEAVVCLSPGSDLPVRVLAGRPRRVAVDFEAAVAESTSG
jgi:hypothetical protein